MSAGQFALTVQGVNMMRRSPVESWRVTETGPDSNSSMEFDIEYPRGEVAPSYWSNLSQDVMLNDSSGGRYFKGNLVNASLTHLGPSGYTVHCTCLGYNAWLDRLVIPTYRSRRANGNAITSERDMVQSVGTALGATPAGLFAFSAPATYISNTNTNMGIVKVDGGTVRDVLNAIADEASTTASPDVRRFYVDIYQHLRWYQASIGTGLVAPYIIGDANYSQTVHNTAGIVSFWHMGESTGTSGYDMEHNSTLGYSAGYGALSLVPNERAQHARSFSGSTFATATQANVHLGDGPWTFECTFLRTTGSAQMAIYSGNTNDVLIGFDATDHIRIQKEGTGDHWVSDAAFPGSSGTHHLMVTRTGATTTVYLDGAAKNGTTTARTFAAGAGNIDIGRKRSTTDQFFIGYMSHVAIYNVALNATQYLAHYKDSQTVVPEYIDFERDANSSGRHVYVKGANAAGTGWVFDPGNSNYNQSFMLDYPDSTSNAKKQAVGLNFLRSSAGIVVGGTATVVGSDGWRAGALLTVDDSALGVNSTFEIRQIDTTFGAGNGVNTYDIAFGALPWSGTFDVRRKRRGTNSLSGSQLAG